MPSENGHVTKRNEKHENGLNDGKYQKSMFLIFIALEDSWLSPEDKVARYGGWEA